MKRVLLLTLDFPPTFIGGISAWSSDLAAALHGAGHSVTVIAKRDGDTAGHDDEKPYPIIRARGRSWGRWQSLWMRWAAAKHIDNETLVISATWTLATRLLPLIQARGAQLAVAFHGSEITTLTDPTSGLCHIFDQATLLLPVSSFLQQELTRLGCAEEDPRIKVLPMPLCVSPTPDKRKRQNLICVARPTSRKGIDRAIRIARIAGQTLELIGPTTGPPGTIAHGPLPRDETLRRMGRAKAIILTPEPNEQGLGEEGLGLVLLEAAARGVPAIGCRTGGVPEAVGPGLILEDPDNPNTERIHRFLQEERWGIEARAWVQKNHGPRRCLDVLEAGVS